jgi:hypothetical protein
MGTTVFYNGVELQNVLTRQWEQAVQYDGSNTDMLHHRFNLRFEAVLHTLQYNPTEPLGAFAMSMNAQQISTRYRDVRELLAQPRGRLEVYMGNQLVFACYPSNGAVNDPNRDVDNGPKPKDLSVVRVAGDRAFRVSFSVECAKVECTDGKAPPVVLNNRWSIQEVIDVNCFTIRTITGTLRLSLPGATTPNGPYQVAWRGMVVPSLEFGFRRESMEFTCAKNGLDCDYTVVDRQIHTAAPWPATTMSVTHAEDATENGYMTKTTVQVRLGGPPHVDRRLLIARAVDILDARTRYLTDGTEEEPMWILEAGYIREYIGEENAIEAGLTLLRTPKNQALWMAGLPPDTIGSPLSLEPFDGRPYSPQVSTPPSVYGYDPTGNEDRLGVLAVLQCYLQSPCSDQHEISQPNTSPTIVYEDVTGGLAGAESQEEFSLQKKDSDKLSDSAQHSLYTHCAVESDYHISDMTVTLPLARAANAAGDACRTISLAPAQCIRTITFDAERVGAWPSVPKPVLDYADGSLRARRIGYKLVPHPPTLSADRRTYIYRVRGEFRYQLNRAPTEEERLRTGALPFTSYGVSETQFDTMQAYDVTRGT